MGRRKKGDKIDGWINLDKPQGLTSTQALGKVRRILNAQKAGHAGTLDPLATGILPIALGEATKTIPYCQDAMKTYRFTVKWGEQRDTDDAEGDIVATSDLRPSENAIRAILHEFLGEIEQIPPQFSAIKINGERAYDIARCGEHADIKPRTVYIEELELINTTQDDAEFLAYCGKGTYIRSLARDMAKKLGTYGHITALRREQVGPFSLGNAISLEKLEEIVHSAPLEAALLPLETALDDIPALALSEQEAARLKNGQKLTFFSRLDVDRLYNAGVDIESSPCEALTTYKGKPIALVEVDGAEIWPVRVLNL